MEERLQTPGCDVHPGQSLVLGDAPRGDGLPGRHLLQGMGQHLPPARGEQKASCHPYRDAVFLGVPKKGSFPLLLEGVLRLRAAPKAGGDALCTSAGNEQLLALPAGARAALSVQVGRLAGVLSAARGRLSNASQASGCSDHGHPKMCVLLSEIRAVLQSAQREVLHAADTLAATVWAREAPGAGGCPRVGRHRHRGVRGKAWGPRGCSLGVSLLLLVFEGDSSGNPPAAHQLEPPGAGCAGAG